MNSNQSYCLGGRHYSQTVKKNIFQKLNPKTIKLVNIIKGTTSTCERNRSPVFT